jgi:hypothetical protein
MDFKDSIKLLGDRIAKLKDSVTTEEATKNAFIMPFIKELGYDVFNPFEVVPEFTADIGIKQGEKIDYAIMKDGHPIILIECKCHLNPLSIQNASQLFRYFHTTKAKFSILSNGTEYRFYTDLVEPNKMDEKPFFVINITDIKDAQIDELKKFHKAYFDFTNIVNTASELKYTNELKLMINSELTNPSPDFVRHFARKIYPGMVNQKILDQFTELTKKSFSQYLNDIINDRLKLALTKETEIQKTTDEIKDPIMPAAVKVETTQDELEAFYIIRAILRSKVKVDRIVHRDAQSYFAILLDDNNRKPICRLYFTDKRKQIGIMDETKTEKKYELASLDNLYDHSGILIKAVEGYLKESTAANGQ